MTSHMELEILYDIINRADSPEKIFGHLEGVADKLSAIKDTYRKLARAVHPDHCVADCKEKGGEAFAKISHLYEQAQKRIALGLYGSLVASGQETANDFIIKTKKGEYRIKQTLAQGDLAMLYFADSDRAGQFPEVAIKVLADPLDNDLMLNEMRMLGRFQADAAKQNKHFLPLLDQFKTSENQLGIVLPYLRDCYDLYSVREKYQDGVPEKHMVWMLNRLLSALGYVHSLGITHNCIEPSHLMIRPKDHNLFLIDWSYASFAAEAGAGFKVYNEDFSPPEAERRKPPLPSSDLYSVGKCMIYLLGGDPKTKQIPRHVDKMIRLFLEFLVEESPLQRAQDAWEMHQLLNDLVVGLWGPKRFLEFEM